jgi:RNA polymerase sigma-70 factor (ECF subfamily)
VLKSEGTDYFDPAPAQWGPSIPVDNPVTGRREDAVSREVTIHARGGEARATAGLRSVAGGDELSLLARRFEKAAPFEEIYERFHSRIHNLAFRITRNRQDAEDVVQECFMRTFQHLDTFAGRSKLSTWISRIAINAALMKIRKRRRYESSLDDILDRSGAGGSAEIAQDHLAPDQLLLQRELKQVLAEGLARLSPGLSGVVDLYYFRELSARECAQILGISLANAKARILRARLKLRPAFERGFRSPIIPFRIGCCRKYSFQ